MKLAKTLSIGGGGVALAVLLGLLAPKTAHAVVATLVQVANTSSNPVPNRDQDNPAQQPFQEVVIVNVPSSGIIFNAPVFNVPLGKRAVIEYASAHGCCGPTSSVSIGEMDIVATGGGVEGIFSTLLQNIGSGNWMSGFALRAYADAGTQVQVNLITLQPVAETFKVTVSGHFVNIP